MSIKVTAITFKKNPFDAAKQALAIKNGLRATGEGAKVDFLTTTKTWDHQPSFDVKVSGSSVTVATNDPIYVIVSKGAEPHIIRPRAKKRLVFRRGGTAKTSPGVIGSRQRRPAAGKLVFSRGVRHPGVVPRRFDDAVKKKWEKQFPITMQRAINAAVR